MNILYALQNIRTPFLDTLMGYLTELGGETAFMVVAIILFWCVDKRYGYYILTTGFTGTILNQFLKITFRIPRPWVQDSNFTIVESAKEGATGYSFPSGHTQNAVSTFGGMARWTKSWGSRALFCAVVVAVAFSRMYLGVHTPLDVGVSFILGIVLVFALYPVFRDMEERPKTMYIIFSAMLILTIAYIAYTDFRPFPADIDADNLESARKAGYTMLGSVSAMFLSFHLDRKYIRFETGAKIPAQIAKVVLGLGIVLALKILLKEPLLTLFDGSNAAHAVRYFIIVLFAAAIWPMTFRWFGRWGGK
ncbi:MAG: phosphatase PAP2 family protein [Clostridia bacterium]|nr:phosphatase PAP2 family protein [Clostridia bacterium]